VSAEPTTNYHSADFDPPDRLRPCAREDRSWHLTILIGSILLLLGGLAAEVDSEGAVFATLWPDAKIPVVCPTRRFLGISCPACGLTRSVTHLIRGRTAESFACHRLGSLVLLVVSLQIPYRAWRLTGRGARLDRWRLEDAVLVGFFILLLVNWLVP
jgi:hypothetical protein